MMSYKRNWIESNQSRSVDRRPQQSSVQAPFNVIATSTTYSDLTTRMRNHLTQMFLIFYNKLHFACSFLQ